MQDLGLEHTHVLRETPGLQVETTTNNTASLLSHLAVIYVIEINKNILQVCG